MFLSASTAFAISSADARKVDELRASLSKATKAADSLKIMYDIFDLSGTKTQESMCVGMYHLAGRAGDEGAQLDMMRNYVRINEGNDSLQAVAEKLAGALPASEEQRETMCYIRLKRAQTAINDPLVEVKRMQMKRVNDLLDQYHKVSSGRLDDLEQVELLFSICIDLNSTASGGILGSKLAELQEVIQRMKRTEGGICYMFYRFAVSAYINIGDTENALKACKKYLEYLDEIEAKYHASGRMYRNLDILRYPAYCRILSQYKDLEMAKVDKYYNRVLDIVAKDPEAADDFNHNHRAEVFYLMAHKNYNQALALLKKVIDQPETTKQWDVMITTMIDAARQVGDKDAELHALELYKESLEDFISEGMINSANELQILYDSNNHIAENGELKMQNRQIEAEQHKRWLVFVAGVFVVLFIFVVVMIVTWRRARRTAVAMDKLNKSIMVERDSIRLVHQNLVSANERAKVVERKQNEVIQNMSRDIAEPTNTIVSYVQLIIDAFDANSQPYLLNYIKVVKDNTALLQSLVNDLLDSADAEHARITVSINNFSLSDAINISADSLRGSINPDVKLIVQNLTPDVSDKVDSDSHRVEQIVRSLLANAAKFTFNGTITLDYAIDRQQSLATIRVTDTGIGIPEGKEEIIFDRFAKLNPATQGFGLGLYLSRKLARLIGGEVHVDKDYRRGARFVFTFPIAGRQYIDNASDKTIS